jgi:CHAP domain-containing protein
MTLTELQTLSDKFINDNNGKFIERVDPSALNQCFDLAIYWCEYLGLPKSVFSGLGLAHQIYDGWSNPQFAKIANSADFVPQKGDIVVFSGSLNGGVGHVSIATGKGDTNSFESFDQNWKAGSPATLVTHNYNFVLGVQRFNTTNSPIEPMNNDTKKAGQFNLIVNELFAAKLIPTDNSDALLDNNPVAGAVANLIKDDSDKTAEIVSLNDEIEVLNNKMSEQIIQYKALDRLLQSNKTDSDAKLAECMDKCKTCESKKPIIKTVEVPVIQKYKTKLGKMFYKLAVEFG